LAGLNVFDRITAPNTVYDTTFSSTWTHLREQDWVLDTDPFGVDQFGHPYQGAILFQFSRGSGISFWRSTAYSILGSFVWKMAGETDMPTTNDQISTGLAGPMLGEALFRMSSLILEDGGSSPSFWRETGAGILSPPLLILRRFNRFKAIFPAYDPATFLLARVGGSTEEVVTDNRLTQTIKHEQGTLGVSFSYGLPGKSGYEYKRPFDYFSFDFDGNVTAPQDFQKIEVQGLLVGSPYFLGPSFQNASYHGLWGLFAGYDYLSPDESFRVSTTTLSIGNVGQLWATGKLAIQGSVFAAAGYGAGGAIPSDAGERDFHFGITPEAVVSLRAIYGDRAMLDVSGREYYVSGLLSDDTSGAEQIFHATASFTLRVFRRHGFGIQFTEANRHAHYVVNSATQYRNQTEGIFSIYYCVLGHRSFGAVDWRGPGSPK